MKYLTVYVEAITDDDEALKRAVVSHLRGVSGVVHVEVTEGPKPTLRAPQQ